MQKGSKKIRSAAPAGNKAHNPKHNPKHDPKQSQKVTHEVRKGGKVAQIVELEDDEDLDLGAQLSLDGPDDEEDDEDDEDFEDDDEDDEDDEELEGDDEDEDEDDEEEDDEANEDSSDDSEDEEIMRLIDAEEGGKRPQKTKGKKETPPAVPAPVEDDSDTDSSDEEHVKNTLGNIPLEWYDDYPHIGYDLEGKKIMKSGVTKDSLDKFLDKMENPDEWWKTLHDKVTDTDVVLTDKELEMIERITGGHFPNAEFDPFEKSIDFFTGEKMIHPVSDRPEPKSRFVPSKWEAKKVVKLARAIRMGWIKVKEDVTEKPRYHLLWNKSDDDAQRPNHIPAPKVALPQHNESYNPPEEYLFTKGQEKQWKESEVTERKQNFIPKKYPSLRLVPAYDRILHERFERCLDLYLCPRVRKNRINIDPESLIPKLPNPKDLQPFPTALSILYEGHTDRVRTLSVDPTGQWLATGSDDKTIRIWEVSTARCVKTIEFPDQVIKIAWNPNKAISIIAAACGRDVYLVNPLVANEEVVISTDAFVSAHFGSSKENSVDWQRPLNHDHNKGVRLILKHNHEVNFVTWHRKGDYFSSVCPDGKSKSVFIHQLSKHASQNPFKKNAGLIQCVQFHPSKPIFFVATQRTVRVYNLMQQELIKKLQSSSKWISSMDIHPKGDNVVVGSYDKRLSWFDMDLSAKPYKVLRYHSYAIRRVAFHRNYPLFASASDDGTIQIFHGMVYNDLLQNPLIVPLKILKGHKQVDDYGVLDCEFHPTQPWIFSSGADKTVRLYC